MRGRKNKNNELRKTGIIYLKSLTKGTDRLEPLQDFGYQENRAEYNRGEELLKGFRILSFLLIMKTEAPSL